MKPNIASPRQSDNHFQRSASENSDDARRNWRQGPAILHELIRAQAQNSPDAIAAVYETQWLTYRELIIRSDSWANHLRRLGVDVGTTVGIHLERSLNLPVVVLAILEAGAVCVPLEPSLPTAALEAMIRGARLSLVLTESSLQSQLPATDIPLVVVDQTNVSRGHSPALPLTENHLAFVLFTSGSTGKPKGVMISHATIAARMFRPDCEVPPPGTCMAIVKTAISHSPFLGETLAPLLHGCYFAIARPGGHQDISYLGKLIIDHALPYIAMTSTILRAFLDWPGASQCRSLKGVYCGGEAVTDDLRQRFFKCLGQTQLLVSYGTSEGGHKLTCACAPNGPLDDSRIGSPIENAQVRLLDRVLEPIPAGEIGEMYLAGPRLASGYLNQPAATAERFLPDPHSATPGKRMFWSGDFARLRSDGEFEFRGRADQQVKILGNRVELSEIEAAIAACPGIHRAVVTARTNGRGDMQLLAYIVAESKSDFSAGVLRKRLMQRLPQYMVPSVFIPLESIPVSINGKVDRRALPDPPVLTASAASDSNPVAADMPRDDAETLVANVFERFLELERVGIYDDFFSLGGHSLLAVEVIAEINRISNSKLGAVDLIRCPTAEKLGGALKGAIPRQGPSLIPLCEAPGQSNLFCILGIQSYQDLARVLKTSLSVYAVLGPVESQVLEAMANDRAEFCFPPVEEIARQYIAVIRDAQPTGPYHLLGHSFGGVIATEIARQLHSEGQQINFIGLLDCAVGPASQPSKARWLKRRIHQFVAAPAKLLGYRKSGGAGTAIAPDPPWRPKIVQAQQAIKAEWSNHRYQYAGSVTLFRALDEDRSEYFDRPDYGWKDHVQGRIVICELPGDHLSILKMPYVELLANSILKAVATADDGIA